MANCIIFYELTHVLYQLHEHHCTYMYVNIKLRQARYTCTNCFSLSIHLYVCERINQVLFLVGCCIFLAIETYLEQVDVAKMSIYRCWLAYYGNTTKAF
jgi:hypothetical protein